MTVDYRHRLTGNQGGAAIRRSEIELPDEVRSSMTFHDYFGLGVIIISIPPQNALSYVDTESYTRSGDDTVLASDGKTIVGPVGRFA